jgi:hypothetical protein
MTYHFDLNLWQILAGCAVLFGFAVFLVLVCFSIIIDAFQIKFPLPVTAVDEPDVEPPVESVESSVDSPTVHIGQIVPAPRQREPVDLPAASGPVKYGDAPLFDTLAMPLPPFEADFSFVFGPASWSTRTGEFPVIEAAVEPPPKARERFAATTAKRKGGKRTVSVDVGGDVRSEDMAVA